MSLASSLNCADQYRSGLNVVDRLRPITFDWKTGGLRDVGFGAEDVAKVDPLFVIYNKDGQVEGVKYDRITVALVNAVKEQQVQIKQQTEENTQLKARLEQLENSISRFHRSTRKQRTRRR